MILIFFVIILSAVIQKYYAIHLDMGWEIKKKHRPNKQIYKIQELDVVVYQL